MRIKKQFLNEESLKPYGFTKKILYNDEKYVEYWNERPYCDIFIQRCTGEVAIAIDTDCCDCADIDDVVYHLIVDGLVEL